MNKIPTLYVRDENDRRYVTDQVTPGCEWVIAGEGVATRKYDGTCVLIRRDGLAVHGFARREVKPGKEPPPHWREVGTDEVTGKRVGWEPIGQSGFSKFFDEAVTLDLAPGTFELVGPKINGNPERLDCHVLQAHATAEKFPYDFQTPESAIKWARICHFEGVVWHHPDGRMAKLKVRDFPVPSKEGE